MGMWTTSILTSKGGICTWNMFWTFRPRSQDGWKLVRPAAYTSTIAAAFTWLTPNVRAFSTASATFPALWTPVRCPTSHFNYDTNYPELAPTSTGVSTLSHKIALTSDASYKLWVPRPPLVLSDLATKSRVPTVPPFQLRQFARMAQRTQKSNLLMVCDLL